MTCYHGSLHCSVCKVVYRMDSLTVECGVWTLDNLMAKHVSVPFNVKYVTVLHIYDALLQLLLLYCAFNLRSTKALHIRSVSGRRNPD